MITFFDMADAAKMPFDPDTSITGWLPSFFDEDDPRPAAEQLHENYAHGGGFRPMSGFKWNGVQLSFPGDPTMYPVAVARLHDEALILYPHSILLIAQKDGSWQVARVD